MGRNFRDGERIIIIIIIIIIITTIINTIN